MAKNPIPLAYDLRPHRRRRKLLPIASLFVLAPLLAPLLLEAASLCYAHWCEVLGGSAQARTPIIDSIGERIQSAREDLWGALSAHFQRVPWNPKVILPVGAVIMAVAMLMLRR